MKVLEWFCGTKSFVKVAQERGHETFTIDIDGRFRPDMVADLSKLQVTDLPKEWRHPDVIWASPPCQCFSVASIGTHWTGGKEAYIPKTDSARFSIGLVGHVLDLIEEMRPKVAIVENPRGVLRKLGLFQDAPRTAWYCQYGDERAKPTDLWTNLDGWRPKTCHNGCKDHAEARRGAKTGTQGRNGKVERAIVPRLLCEEILIECEKVCR